MHFTNILLLSAAASIANAAVLPRTANPSVLLKRCSWEGHCEGSPCGNENDCSDDLICRSGQCSNPNGGSNPPPPPPPPSGNLPGWLRKWNQQHGSIFRFGDPSGPRQEFYNSGSCGLSTYFQGRVPDWMPLVAMPISVMQQFGESQHNKLCGRTISIKGPNGQVKQAAVADTNMSRNDNSVDMTLDLWEAFGGHDGDGSLLNIQWKMD